MQLIEFCKYPVLNYFNIILGPMAQKQKVK